MNISPSIISVTSTIRLTSTDLLQRFRVAVNLHRQSLDLSRVKVVTVVGALVVLGISMGWDFLNDDYVRLFTRVPVFLLLLLFVRATSAEMERIEELVYVPALAQFAVRAMLLGVATACEIYALSESGLSLLAPLLLLLAEVLVQWKEVEPLRWLLACVLALCLSRPRASRHCLVPAPLGAQNVLSSGRTHPASCRVLVPPERLRTSLL